MADTHTLINRINGPSLVGDATQQLGKSLAYVPPDRNWAVVAAPTSEGIRAAIVGRKTTDRNTWQVETWVEKEWKGDLKYGATVLWTFR